MKDTEFSPRNIVSQETMWETEYLIFCFLYKKRLETKIYFFYKY